MNPELFVSTLVKIFYAIDWAYLSLSFRYLSKPSLSSYRLRTPSLFKSKVLKHFINYTSSLLLWTKFTININIPSWIEDDFMSLDFNLKLPWTFSCFTELKITSLLEFSVNDFDDFMWILLQLQTMGV